MERGQALHSTGRRSWPVLEENDILFVGGERIGERVGERQALISQELATLSIRSSRRRLSASPGKHAQPGDPGDRRRTSGGLQDPDRPSQGGGDEARGRYRELGQSFKPSIRGCSGCREHPGASGGQIHTEDPAVRRAAPRVRAALQKETEVRKTRRRAARVGAKLDGQMARYNLPPAEVDTSRDLYTGLSTRLKETQVASSLSPRTSR